MSISEHWEYLYLVFARDRFFTALVDGQETGIRSDSAGSALKTYFDEFIADTPELEREQWLSEFQQFKGSCTVESIVWQRGSTLSRVSPLVRITFPSGASEDCEQKESEVLIEAAFVHKKGRCPSERTYSDWQKSTSAKASEQRIWVCSAFEADGKWKTVNVDLSDWWFGAPLKGITKTLNFFGSDGWSVVNSTEDKGLYTGTDAANESFPSRIRYLLQRPMTSPILN